MRCIWQTNQYSQESPPAKLNRNMKFEVHGGVRLIGACSVSLRLFVSRYESCYESRYESRYVVSALLFDSCAT